MARAWMVAVVPLLAAACGGSSSAGDATGPSAAALAACARFASTLPGSPTVDAAQAETAGQVVRNEELNLGHAVHPWDQLPADHPVFACGYSSSPAADITWYVIDTDGHHTHEGLFGGLIQTG